MLVLQPKTIVSAVFQFEEVVLTDQRCSAFRCSRGVTQLVEPLRSTGGEPLG